MKGGRRGWTTTGCLAVLIFTACSEQARSVPKDAGQDAVSEEVQPSDVPQTQDINPTKECQVDPPTECTDPNLTYDDIAPIIEARCYACHDGKTKDRWPLTSYGHVVDWHVELHGAMLSCKMPPPDSGIPMLKEERELILHWLKCGFPK